MGLSAVLWMAHLLLLLLHNSHSAHKIEQILFSLSFFKKMTDLSWNWSQQVRWFSTDSKESTNVHFSKALQKPTSSLFIVAVALCQTFENCWKVLFCISNYEELCKKKGENVITINSFEWSNAHGLWVAG